MTNQDKTHGVFAPGDGDPVAQIQPLGPAEGGSPGLPHLDKVSDGPPPHPLSSTWENPVPKSPCGASGSNDAPDVSGHRNKHKRMATALVDDDPLSSGSVVTPSPDPAITIALAIRLGRMARGHSATLPISVVRSLRSAVVDGNAAASLVENWGTRIGVIQPDRQFDSGRENVPSSSGTRDDHD